MVAVLNNEANIFQEGIGGGQTGLNSDASITQRDQRQYGTINQTGINNSAAIDQASDTANTGGMTFMGDPSRNNDARITQAGVNGVAMTTQNGLDNDSMIKQLDSSIDNKAVTTQIGWDNNGMITQGGGDWNMVDNTQEGSHNGAWITQSGELQHCD